MSDEVSKALAADAAAEDTIFGKILRKEIPCDFIHEDDQVQNTYKQIIQIENICPSDTRSCCFIAVRCLPRHFAAGTNPFPGHSKETTCPIVEIDRWRWGTARSLAGRWTSRRQEARPGRWLPRGDQRRQRRRTIGVPFAFALLGRSSIALATRLKGIVQPNVPTLARSGWIPGESNRFFFYLAFKFREN